MLCRSQKGTAGGKACCTFFILMGMVFLSGETAFTVFADQVPPVADDGKKNCIPFFNNIPMSAKSHVN